MERKTAARDSAETDTSHLVSFFILFQNKRRSSSRPERETAFVLLDPIADVSALFHELPLAALFISQAPGWSKAGEGRWCAAIAVWLVEPIRLLVVGFGFFYSLVKEI